MIQTRQPSTVGEGDAAHSQQRELDKGAGVRMPGWEEGSHLPPPIRVARIESIRTQLLSDAEIAQRCNTVLDVLTSWSERPASMVSIESVTPLQVSTKASVVRVRFPGGSAVVKVHADRDAFDRELFAYTLLSTSTPSRTPMLLASLESERLLVLEDVPERARVASSEAFCSALVCLGELHGAAHAQGDLLQELFAECTLGDIQDHLALPPNAPASRALQILIEDLGPAHIPLSVGDLKLGHYRRRVDGSTVILDLETCAPGVAETSDLLDVLNLVDEHYSPTRLDWLNGVASYLSARGDSHDRERRAEQYVEAITLTAESVGMRLVVP